MANVTIDSLNETAGSALTSSHFLVVDNGTTTTKLAALSAAIKTITTLGSAGAGVVKSIALGVLSQRDIVGGTGVTVTQNTNDLTLSVTQGDITISNLGGISSFDLANCDNTTSAFLSTVNLASNVTGTLPIANGGTGQTSFTANSVLLGGTSISTAVLDADKEILVGTSNGPEMKTLTAGSNVSIAQDNSADTLTIAFSKGNFIEAGDSPSLGDTVMREATVDKLKTSGTKAATQAGAITSTVTCNGSSGVVTLVTTGLAANTVKTFTLENTELTADSVVLLTLLNPTAADEDVYHVSLQSVNSGRANIVLTNNTTVAATSQTRKLHYFIVN
tara:strand:- start:62722 stop:63720 length:999 start_codon:yes stop_codon:yes gene_type:complete